MKRARIPETHFPWHKARRGTPEEAEEARKAIEAMTGKPRPPRGRPPLPEGERAQSVTIRLSPRVVEWARVQAAKRGIGYQTFLNETLERVSAS
ncbi:MAG: BrnA antitoxin family protein [bacterium]